MTAALPPEIDTFPLRFLWLLRSDIRKGHGIETPEARRLFLVWWIMIGRREYAVLGDILPPAHRQWLSAPSPEIPQDAFMPISRVMVEIWRWREDLQSHFTLDHAEGRTALARWFVVDGLVEHELGSYLSESQWAALNAPGIGLAAGLAPLNSLHVAAWMTAPEEVRTHFPLDRPEIRPALRTWLDQGQPVASDRLRRNRVPAPPAPGPLPVTAPSAAFGVNLIGFAHGEFGIGEDVRMAARACTAAGIPFSVFDVPVRSSRHRSDDRRLSGLTSRSLPYPVNLFCATGFDTASLFLEYGAGLFENRINIGYWPWELAEWPENWVAAFDLMDEIWSSTRFTQDAMAAKAPIPVQHMPMAVEAAPVRRYGRASFALPEDRLLFLYTFDWNSYVDRKNPLAAVTAFQAAFPDPTLPVGLVLKTMGGADADPDWQKFRQAIAQDRRIGIIDTVLDRDAVLGLCAVCDVVISLHRGEGYGRTLAEAMLLGKPVIATAYSGNLDFCTAETAALVPARLIPVRPGQYPHAEGMHWADPDLEMAVAALRRLAADPACRNRLGENGRRFLQQWADPARVGQRYAQRLTRLLRRKPATLKSDTNSP